MKLLLSILGLVIAPIVGAYKAMRDELNRPVVVYPTLSSRIKDSIRIYFAPLSGAIHETRERLRQLADVFFDCIKR